MAARRNVRNDQDKTTIVGIKPVLAALLVFTTSTAGSIVARQLERPISSALVFVLGVTVIGAISGIRGGLLAGLAASFIYNFFLSDPVLQFSASSAEELLPLIAFNVCAIISGLLAGRLNDRARIAERAQARLNVLLVVSDSLQKAVLLPDIALAMNSADVRPWLGHFELYDATGKPVASAETPPRWGAFAATSFEGPMLQSEDGAAIAYRLERVGGGTLGYAVFGEPEDRSGSRAVDMDALIALVAMAVERCLLLDQLSQSEGIRRSEELKTALLSSLSHDMRTPLSAISASASSLLSLSDDLDPAVRLKLLQTIKEQGERLDRYTANLLDLGRLQAGIDEEILVEVDVVEILGVVLHSARANAAHPIAKQIDCPVAIVRANPAMVEQIFRNLLDNAVRYSPEESLIAVRLSCTADIVRVEIIDQGVGVPKDELPHLFDRFYRSSRTAHQQGHGLGLSIAKGFVEAFRGQISIHSPHAGGMGTQVIVQLPLCTRDHEVTLAHG